MSTSCNDGCVSFCNKKRFKRNGNYWHFFVNEKKLFICIDRQFPSCSRRFTKQGGTFYTMIFFSINNNQLIFLFAP